ncbi:nitrate reductase [bacterium DOLJORAL78_65_58]|nr:MAG: nitrate reductase [bacterium DOLZORAL124_64_63]PIE76055.1 MAG: nitrate reductase [bacterium DOLJORAL78_65_58]
MIKGWRHTSQTVSLLLLVAIPLANYHWRFTFLQGWYQSLGIGPVWIVSPLEGLESILVTRAWYPPLLWALAIPVLVAVLLGRVFCSWVCPINTLQEAGDKLLGRRGRARDRWLLPKAVLWYILVAELVTALILGTPLWVFLSPPGLVGREIMTFIFFRTLAWEGVVVLAVLAANLFTRRFYCRYLCPLGALLALLGGKRRLAMVLDSRSCTRCKRCDRACPIGLRPSLGESSTLTCWNCGRCADVCSEEGLRFHWAGPHQPPAQKLQSLE